MPIHKAEGEKNEYRRVFIVFVDRVMVTAEN